MGVRQLLGNLHGQAVVQSMVLKLLSFSLVAHVWHSPILLIDWARTPLANVHNPVIKVTVHVEVDAQHVELKGCLILQLHMLSMTHLDFVVLHNSSDLHKFQII